MVDVTHIYGPRGFVASDYSEEPEPVTDEHVIGCLFTKHTDTEAFSTLLWRDLVDMVRNPFRQAKNEAPCLAFHDVKKKTRSAVLAADSMMTCWVDLDTDDRTLEGIKHRLLSLGVTVYVVYSTASSKRVNPKTGEINGPRWRIIIPTSRIITVDLWGKLQNGLSRWFESDTSAERIQQIAYLPTIDESLPGEVHYEYAISEKGELLHPHFLPPAFSNVIDILYEERQQRAESIKDVITDARNELWGRGQKGGELINRINDALDLSVVLRQCGYAQRGNTWQSPNSESGSFGVMMFDGDKEQRWISFHESDRAIGMTTTSGQQVGDAFDLLSHHEFGGDHALALKTLSTRLIPTLKEEQREYMQAAEAEAKVDEAPTKPRSVPFSQLNREPPEWVIKNILPTNSLCVLFGPPGGGKSFLALDMAFHIALGEPWNGNKINRPGGVYYICGEGDNGIGRRADAWEHEHRRQLPGEELHKTTSAVPLTEAPELQRVIDDINSKVGLRCVIIDTLNRNFGPGDENSTEDMTAFVQACDRIKDECGVLVLVVHHTGLVDSKRPRGSSALIGAADVNLMLAPNDNDLPGFKMIGLKMKDAEKPAPIEFELKTIALGVDEDGDDYTSCVVRRVTNDSNLTGMGSVQKRLLAAAKALSQRIKTNLGDDDAVAIFTADHLFETLEGDDKMKRKNFNRDLVGLYQRGCLRFDAPHYEVV